MEQDNSTHILTAETVNQAIAELIVDTPSEDVKCALRIYQFKKSIKQMEREYTSLPVTQLKATLSYLNVPDDVEYLKHELVINLICRIQNLLPEKCSICSETYCIQKDEKPFLPCSKCGQEAHKECIMEILDTPDKGNLDEKSLMKKLNPFNISGFHYLCKACEEATIPSKTTARKSKKKKKTDPIQSQNSSNGNSLEENAQSSLIADTQSQSINTILGETQVYEVKDEGDKEKKPHSKACRFYRNGTCKHGISGKGCDFEHPKMCQKLLRHGTRQPEGCSQGKKCDKFHPKMCPTSINKLECFDEKCRLRHVRGTKREKEKEKKKEEKGLKSQTEEVPDDSSSSLQGQNDFLGALRQLKTELLEAMDMKLAMTLSQTHYAQPTMQGQYPQNQMMNIVPSMIQQVPMNFRQTPMQYMYPLNTIMRN